MTWPWAAHLRNAVADPGDPYAHAWELWWNYHQTFTDPLNLFQANVFYPHEYALAYTEHGYGIAVFFFPLFALGLRPLTVHSIASFVGFAFCGYAAFRLGRTLTGSTGAGLIAGILYGFIPNRYLELSHIHYLYSGWTPLMLEALVLFARQTTWKRAAWLGTAFLFNGLTAITWLLLSLVPMAFSLVLVLRRYERVRDLQFWLQSGVAMVAASLAMLPFMLPYYHLSQSNHFFWTLGQLPSHTPSLANWITGEGRSKAWRGLGAGLGADTGLFPGVMILALSAVAFLRQRLVPERDTIAEGVRRINSIAFPVILFISGIWLLLTLGYGSSNVGPALPRWMFGQLSADTVLFAITTTGLIWVIVSARTERGEILALGTIWTVTGFLFSLGANTFFFRFLYTNVFLFQSQRVPSRAGMICYLGLAILAAAGTKTLADAAAAKWPRVPRFAVATILAVICLFEFRAYPLEMFYGEVYPDELTQRIGTLQMNGGLLELPTGRGKAYEHRYMLRAADHAKPLINASGTFLSPTVDRIEEKEEKGPISPDFMDYIESIPTSYVTLHRSFITDERRADFDKFVSGALASGRLRHIGTYDGTNELYAVTKNEPDAVRTDGQ